MTNSEVYQIVADRLISEMKDGKVPWRRPWRDPEGMGPVAVSHSTGRFYRGVNAILLPPGEYVTFKGARAEGGSVRKGEQGFPVVFWKFLESKTDFQSVPQGDGSVKRVPKRVPLLRYYTVFELSQCDGLKRRHAGEQSDPAAVPDAILAGYKNPPQVVGSPHGAWYRASEDTVGIPASEQFETRDEFFSTLYHELVHSTGHDSRLSRLGWMDNQSAVFGSEDYSKEELVAEFGSAMLCAVAGVDNNAIIENQAAYLRSWMDRISGEPALAVMAVMAASAAQKAVDHILGVAPYAESGEE